MSNGMIGHLQAMPTDFREKPDNETDPIGETGWFLQRDREQRGVTLERASIETGIDEKLLDAIEMGDIDRLPIRSETLRILDKYGRYLGFDPEPLVMYYAQFLPKSVSSTKRVRILGEEIGAKILHFSKSFDFSSQLNGGGGVAASCCGAVVLFGLAGWALWPSGNHATDMNNNLAEIQTDGTLTSVGSVSKIEETALNDAKASTDPLALAADKSAGSLSGLTELIERGGIIDVKKSVKSNNKDKADIKATAKAQPEKIKRVSVVQSGQTGKIYGSENKTARLVLRAKRDVWIRIEDKSGNVITTQTLMSGDSYRVPNKPDLVIIARDGGALGYNIDGKKSGTMGDTGEILVGRSLNIKQILSRKS